MLIVPFIVFYLLGHRSPGRKKCLQQLEIPVSRNCCPLIPQWLKLTLQDVRSEDWETFANRGRCCGLIDRFEIDVKYLCALSAG
jgi:hypothetical protein